MYVATQDWLLSHDRTSAVRRLAAAHRMTHLRPTTNRWPFIVQHKLPAKTVRSDQSDLISGRRLTAANNCLWKRTFRNLNNVMRKIWFCHYRWLLLYKDIFYMKINHGLNDWKLSSKRQRTQWCCNKFQSTIFVASWATIVVQVILAKVYLCGCGHLNMHTRYACFISLQMVIKIQYFVTSHRSQVGIMKNPTG